MAEDKPEGGGKKKSQKDKENQQANAVDDDTDDEEDFKDPEGFVDNITDEELLGDLLRQKPREADGVESVIVVDNIPQVGQERLEKLQNVIRKIFSKFGNIVNENYPTDESGKTKGYIFLEYSSPANAAEAVKMANGYKLDKQHTFLVNLVSDFDRYVNVSEEWEPPEQQPFKDPGNLHQWLLDAECRDQYSVIYEGGEKTAIYLNTPGEPTCLDERVRWTETYVRWSPLGTYLATLHQKGIALWGGEKFKQIMRFSHPGVQLIDFSPCESYVVTFSPLPGDREDPTAIIIWDARTGQKKRGFHCESASQWPVFKWSHDGKYFARMSHDTLSVYETPSFGLLGKKSIKVSGIKDFSWSPSDNIIAYFVPEEKDVPARVVLTEMPSRGELQTKNLFHVADCRMHWQKSGDYLCVKVDRYAKKKEDKEQGMKYVGITYYFELFRMREKEIPVDHLECKENTLAFAWEPNGHRFAFIHGESPRISASFYIMRPSGKVELLKTMDKQSANHIFWSPNGQFVVLAGLRSMNGTMEFIDTSDMTVMNQVEHYMASDVEWDPSGRYVVSAVSWWAHKVDNAYWMWNFQGRLLSKHPLERFCQFLWRPRPPSLLTPEMIKDIKKNMKKYSTQFELKDRMTQSKASKELIERRRKMCDDFNKYRAKLQEVVRNQKQERLALRDGIDTDELEAHTENFEEEVIEFLEKVEEILIGE
ncbi:eukaryotic translation initiation factor 3 subunit B [Lingula anatina]|uniref:Eukaryotic translation initiation factor 3 subunit B n=1 Tax=Lingula anatina TaxID=7574 RepID=A0A1S3JF76_LINAN|nr:eukaryotic translation initiation factor 3 subunit B [Lingula anatina]|eukprot:XP_013408544.1 eukaryotic translation initiation factor 3 subunit B [Lingula anatina]